MRSLLSFLSGAVFALCATAASAQDLVIDVDQSFTAHPERFGLSASPDLQMQAVTAPAESAPQAANETPPNGAATRDEHVSRDQGDGEATPWERKDKEDDHAAH